jgi:hypothetical protein
MKVTVSIEKHHKYDIDLAGPNGGRAERVRATGARCELDRIHRYDPRVRGPQLLDRDPLQA